jgi:hypothetical protein
MSVAATCAPLPLAPTEASHERGRIVIGFHELLERRSTGKRERSFEPWEMRKRRNTWVAGPANLAGQTRKSTPRAGWPVAAAIAAA